jgi:hypothetical protein
MEKTKYIECSCKTYEHLIRISYIQDEEYNENDFYIDFRINKYPGSTRTYTFDPDKSKDVWYHFTMNLIMKRDAILNYIKCIWWAIKGRPEWYSGYCDIDAKGAKAISDFINVCLKEKSK